MSFFSSLLHYTESRKFWTFVLTAILTFVPYFIPHLPAWYDAIVLVFGGYGIYAIPNAPAKSDKTV